MHPFASQRVGVIRRLPEGYDAFIPHPLFPDGPKLDFDTELMLLQSEADRALGELKGITDLLPNPDLFIAFYVRKEALLSSQIEGTQCSLDDVLQADRDDSGIKPVSEVVNYINAMNYGIEQLLSLPLSIRLIHEIHRHLLKGVRGREKRPGEFKANQNWIGPPGSQFNEATYIPPPPTLMPDLMGDFEKYYHVEKLLPPLMKAAILHAHFETIHPYADGNGRLGRLLITFMLCEKGILDKPLLYLSLFFKEHRADYYDLLMKVRFEGRWEDWIKFFLRGVRNTSFEALRTAREILELQSKDRDRVEDVAHHKASFPCYDLICEQPIISISAASKKLGISYPSMKQTFDDFIRLKILSPYGQKKRNKLFSYESYLEILRRGT